MRTLFIAPPGSGHIDPSIALALELRQRGFEITWAMPPVAEQKIKRTGFKYVSAGPALLDFEHREIYCPSHWNQSGWDEYLLTVLELVIKSTRDIVRDSLDHCSPYDFDLIIADVASPAARILAERWAIPWISVCTTSLSLALPEIPPYAFEDELENGRSLEEFRLGHQKIRDQFNRVASHFGASTVKQGWNDFFSETLTLVVSSPELEYSGAACPDHIKFTGALFRKQIAESLPSHVEDWIDKQGAKPIVYATLGTAFNRTTGLMESLIQGAIESELPTLISSAGLRIAEEWLTRLPSRVQIVPWINHAALFPRMAAVVCHGGMSTCNGALSYGLPTLSIPIGCDQPSVSRKLAKAQAGIRLGLFEATPRQIAREMNRIVMDNTLRNGAQKLQRSYEALGGCLGAADAIERALDKLSERRSARAMAASR